MCKKTKSSVTSQGFSKQSCHLEISDYKVSGYDFRIHYPQLHIKYLCTDTLSTFNSGFLSFSFPEGMPKSLVPVIFSINPIGYILSWEVLVLSPNLHPISWAPLWVLATMVTQWVLPVTLPNRASIQQHSADKQLPLLDSHLFHLLLTFLVLFLVQSRRIKSLTLFLEYM